LARNIIDGLRVWRFLSISLLLTIVLTGNLAKAVPDFGFLQLDTTEKDTSKIDLPYPFKDKSGEGLNGGNQDGGMYLKNPSNIKGEFVYDPDSDSYIYQQKVGERNYRNPEFMTLEEYRNYEMKNSDREFFREKSKEEDIGEGAGFRPKLYVENKTFDRIFGGNTIDIRPQGSAEISFGINTTRRDNPAIPENQRRTTNFDFDEKIQLNVVGSVGDKLKITTSYNTEATFDFENQTKIEYTGYEDEIIQKIELGNVALPLQGSLIQGSQTLFGIKTELKFGRMRITSILSQEKGERKEVNTQGGSQTQEFELSGSDYEDNQHYFLGHYFRDRYNEALSDLPNIVSSFRVNKVDVWVTQVGGQIQNSRNVIAFADLGEGRAEQLSSQDPFYQGLINPSGRSRADNFRSNDLYTILTDAGNNVLTANEKAALRSFQNALQVLTGPLGMTDGRDFERFEAVLLSPSEYTVNEQLGYISLNRQLKPEDIMGVAYEYIINDKSYQVGEISNQAGSNQEAIFIKLLKSSFTNTSVPMWDLMMKNVYYLNSFGISRDEFRFEIWYLNQETGVELPFIADGPIDGELLLQVMELDNLDYYNAKHEDGEFDYIEGVTIRASKGRVYFPVVEPFGSHLRNRLDNNQDLGDRYAFDSLYATTKALAQLDADHNRFTIKGSYKGSSSNEIRLNAFNIPQGSVVVTAGGVRLTENVDYQVDYNLGTVRILNQGLLESKTPIKVSLESNSLFNIQTKTLMGTRVDYDFNENLKVGGTVLNLTERPLTNKVNIGDEAISNTIVGVDGFHSTEAPILTKIADALPFFDTKEKSTVNTSAEFAYLFPGNARAITKEGVAYIDDFEGSQSQIDMKSVFTWRMASTPRGQQGLFPEAVDAADNLAYGYNRARLNWYVIDPLFFNSGDDRLPGNITSEMQQNHYMREVLQREIFPNKALDQTLIGNIPVLDLTYDPRVRGPYNFDLPFGSQYSDGIDPLTGQLNNPESRWGGIMRDIQTVDFTEANIEFLQFWVMDPFVDPDYEQVFGTTPGNGGFLYVNFGEVSEDILKDGRKSFENGYPFPGNDQPVDQTVWGNVPLNKSLVNAFDNLPEARPYQDVGLDGLTNSQEQEFHSNYLSQMETHLSAVPEVYTEEYVNDPAADNFRYFRDESDSRSQNVVERYSKYNGLDGNSPVNTGSFVASSTTIPDIEDVNRDNTMNTKETYFQYKIPVNRNVFNPDNVGKNYVTDVFEGTAPSGKKVNWYQFKIPLSEPDQVVGEIRDFKSIRFMRMFMTGFDKPVILRFARLDLIRGEWRRYTGDLREDGDYIQGEEDDTQFEVNAVNIEENASREPIHYVLPPGIERETDYGTANLQQLNEQALSLYACELNDGATKAAFRNINLDIRQYKRLKMYVHLEDGSEEQNLNPAKQLKFGDISLILRMGQDFEDNYYEYEVPLHPSEFGVHSRESVWPTGNNIDVALERFTDVKLNRDASGFAKSQVYTERDGAKYIRVKGSPNIANVKLMMIGVKNPKQGSNPDLDDDGDSRCVVVWANELRVSDFDNRGGWATTASVRANLADLATMTLSGSMSTPGFGSIEQKLNERQQETKQSYDFTSNIEMGKFTQDALSIPMFFGYSESWDKPRYIPLNPDIELEDIERSDRFSKAQKDSILRSAVKYRNRRSLNFTNVKLNYGKNNSRKHVYDPQNFSFTYAYDLDKYRDVNLEYHNKTNHKGRILWAYSAKPKNYTPFSRSKWAKSKYMRLIRDFNFSLLPNQYSFSTTVDRGYNEKKLRQTNPFYNPRPYYQKRFNWDREYNLQYSITKGLKFRYDAKNQARIDEPEGIVDRDDTSYTRWRETVRRSIREFGTNLNFDQNFVFDYSIPINKIPVTDWVNLSTSYKGGYNWERAAIGSEQYGNTIRNTGALQYNSSLNMNVLYNKVDYFNRLSQTGRGRNKNKIRKSKKRIKEEKEEKNKKGKGDKEGEQQQEDDKKKKKKKKDEDQYRSLQIHDYAFKVLTGIKEISGTYTKSTGTVMPGYAPTNSLLGFDQAWRAPGLPFVLGQKQDTTYVLRAQNDNWLVTGNEEYRYNFENNDGETYTYRINIRPANNLRVELNGQYNYNIGTVMGYTWVDTLYDADDMIERADYNQFVFDNAIQTGSFSVSTLTYRTAFVRDNRNDYSSPTFDKFNEFRPQASRKLADDRAINDGNYVYGVDSTGFYNEYGPTQQDVLISSFLAAYSGKNDVDIGTRNFKSMFPLPNWRITYDGLGKIKFLSKYFQSITINHAYRSQYNVNNFTTNNRISSDTANITTDVATGNYVPKYQVTQVSIVEMFSPFMDIDFNFRNGLLLGFEYKRDRNISLSTINNQITEVKGREYIVSIGYTFRDIRVSFRRDSKANPKDIITRMDISSRDNFSIVRNIGDFVASQPGNGQNVLSIKLTADLAVNPKFNIRGFYDRIVTNPFISNSFPTASTNFGVSLRFSLAQ
jgi:cell surface protein SprA